MSSTSFLLSIVTITLLISTPSTSVTEEDDSKFVPSLKFIKDYSLKQHVRSLTRRSPRDKYLGLCTEDDYANWYLDCYPKECQQHFENATTLHELFKVYCDPFCGDIYFDYLDDCGDVGTVLTTFYSNLCLENEQGVQCFNYFTSDTYENPKPEVEEYCLPINETCGVECFYALEALSVKLGCCTNILYNQSVPNAVADYQLWESCDVPTPEFCTFNGFEFSGSPSVISACCVNLVSIVTMLLLLAALK